jgi:hypothetical protein
MAILYDSAVSKRATPRGILVTVAFLALYCAFSIWYGLTHRLWWMLAVGLLAAIACAGAAAMRLWSRFLVTALSVGFAVTWLYSIWAAARVGYFYPLSWLSIIVSLIPGSLLLLVAAFCSGTAHRHLGPPRR